MSQAILRNLWLSGQVVYHLTLRRPLLPNGYSYKEHPLPDRVKPSFVIFWHPGTLTLRLSVRVSGCQKLQMTA